MAKKKEEEVVEYDFMETILSMQIPDFLKAGFIYRIKEKNLTFTSEKDVEKAYNKFYKGV